MSRIRGDIKKDNIGSIEMTEVTGRNEETAYAFAYNHVVVVALFAMTNSIKKKEVPIQTLLDKTMQFPGMISGELYKQECSPTLLKDYRLDIQFTAFSSPFNFEIIEGSSGKALLNLTNIAFYKKEWNVSKDDTWYFPVIKGHWNKDNYYDFMAENKACLIITRTLAAEIDRCWEVV